MNPCANANAGVRRAGRRRPIHLLEPHTGHLPRPSRVCRPRRALWPLAHEQHSHPGVKNQQTPKKRRTVATQTTPGLRGAGDVPLGRAAVAPQQPRNRDAPTVLHLRRPPAGWSHHHLVDRFMWMDGAVGVAEAFFGGENHGYLTFRSNAQVVAACAVVSAALGTVAPPPGQLPAVVHCVHYDVLCGLKVHTRNDAPAEQRREALPTQAAPPCSDRPPPHRGRRPAPHS